MNALARYAVWAMVATAPIAAAAGRDGDGEAAWTAVCRHCHAFGIGPPLLGRGLDPVYIRAIVRNGLRAMPAFRPPEVDDDALADLAALIAASAAPPAATSGALP